MIKVEQVDENGNITLDYDQKLSVNDIDSCFYSMFMESVEKKGKQYLVFQNVGILACNVTYLGNPHPLYKKRIQLKKYYLNYLKENIAKNIKTLYVGVYTYNETRLFVVFEPSTYLSKKSHNSSAHIFTMNLQYAQKVGSFRKIDGFGNHIYVFDKDNFIDFVLETSRIETDGDNEGKTFRKIINYFDEFSDTIPKERNGISCYKEMVEANDNNARQAEWTGFYFEYLFKKFLNKERTDLIKRNSSKKKGEIDLDVVFDKDKWIYGDFKAENIESDILGNALDTFAKVIEENNGIVYYVCCFCEIVKDSTTNYDVTRYWNSLRDKPYETEDEIKNRYGRKMKSIARPKQISILKIDKVVLNILKQNPFHQGKNSNNNSRKSKLKVTKDLINALTVYQKKLDK